MKPVFVILVTYRRLAHLKETLASLVPTLPAGSALCVVDNASDEAGYSDYLIKELPLITASSAVKLHVLLRNKNDGWGKAMNEGLAQFPSWRDYEYVLESNNDVTYEPDWCAKAQGFMEKYPQVGVLGLWRHPHHGTMEDHGGLLRRDNAPATAWLFRSKDLARFLPFPEHGPTKTRGGNGEDVAMTHRIMDAGFWIGAPKDDLAHHMDGYDLPDLGKPNPAYQ